MLRLSAPAPLLDTGSQGSVLGVTLPPCHEPAHVPRDQAHLWMMKFWCRYWRPRSTCSTMHLTCVEAGQSGPAVQSKCAAQEPVKAPQVPPSHLSLREGCWHILQQAGQVLLTVTHHQEDARRKKGKTHATSQLLPGQGWAAWAQQAPGHMAHLSRWFPTTTSFSSTILGWRRRRSSVISRRLLTGTPATGHGLSKPTPADRDPCSQPPQQAPHSGPRQLCVPHPYHCRLCLLPRRIRPSQQAPLALPATNARQLSVVTTVYDGPTVNTAEPCPQRQPGRCSGNGVHGAHGGCWPGLGGEGPETKDEAISTRKTDGERPRAQGS